MSILKYVLVAVFGYFGVFYLFLPHEIHQVYALDWLLGVGFPHEVHLTLGVIFLIIAGFIAVKG